MDDIPYRCVGKVLALVLPLQQWDHGTKVACPKSRILTINCIIPFRARAVCRLHSFCSFFSWQYELGRGWGWDN